MQDWHDNLPLIEQTLLELYPLIDADSAFAHEYLLNQHIKQRQFLDLFKSIGTEEEAEQLDQFINFCLSNDISYHQVYGDLMTLGRIILGRLFSEKNCSQLMLFNNNLDTIESKIGRVYWRSYLRKLSVKNHIRLTHLANLNEKNLLVHYQSHLQWIIRLINRLQDNELDEWIELDHTRCLFGQWLHGKVTPVLKTTTHFKEVERLHVLLHKLAKEILMQYQQSKTPYKSMLQHIDRLDYISLEIGAEIAILNDMTMINEYHKDPLTGVLTRHLFEKIISSQIEIAKATENQCALLMFDLDHFKDINDNYGHLAGDAVIKNFAELLKITFRKSDFILRFGGEEFLVLAPSTQLQNAKRMADKILHEVRQQVVLTADERTLSYTVSIGVSIVEPMDLTFVNKDAVNQYVGEVDARLYLAKRNGRNRVE